MSKVGRKIIQGAKDAAAIARGEKLPSRMTMVDTDVKTLAWLKRLIALAEKTNVPFTIHLTIEFGQVPKRRKSTKP